MHLRPWARVMEFEQEKRRNGTELSSFHTSSVSPHRVTIQHSRMENVGELLRTELRACLWGRSAPAIEGLDWNAQGEGILCRRVCRIQTDGLSLDWGFELC